MKKSFTVNIKGIIFQVDEDAYNKLNRYLDSLKRHFAKEDGGDEIISDIESRIAEMLQSKTEHKSNVVSIVEVDEVIAEMGQPFEFEHDEYEDNTSEYRKKKRKAKRLYRDADNKILGGVCAGLGAYFNVDPLWFRLLFVALFFAGGSGLLIYLLLWVIVPTAETTAEKLEMKGEAVNIENIEKSVREEFDHLTNKFNEMTQQAKGAFKKKSRADMKGERNSHLSNVFHEIGRLILRLFGIFFGVIFLMFGLSLSVLILVSVVSPELFFVDKGNLEFFDFHMFFQLLFSSPLQYTLSIIALVGLIGIPVLFLLYNGVRLVFNIKITKQGFGLPVFIAWIASVVLSGVMTLLVVKDFTSEYEIVENVSFEESREVVYLDFSGDVALDYINNRNEQFLIQYWYDGDDDVNPWFMGFPRISFNSTDGDLAYAKVKRWAHGVNMLDATDRTEDINYDVYTMGDSLIMDPYFTIGKYERWRDQNMRVRIYLPENTLIRISDSFAEYLNRRYRYYNDPEFEANGLYVLDDRKLIKVNE
jgi:phage shock protein PspC (stress-responsive transcriptional regulator)/tetrahydromethanopterin S-methyltransferase subunit G